MNAGVPPPRLEFLSLHGSAPLACTLWGEGLPLLRMPGWLSNQRLFVQHPEEQIFAQALASLSTPWMEIHYDKQGTGLSGTARADFSLDGMVDELGMLVDRLELERFALLCNSSAGLAGIAYAAHHPLRVSRLVLVNAHACGDRMNMPRLVAALSAIAEIGQSEWAAGSEALAQLLFPAADPDTLRTFSGTAWQRASAETALALWEAYRSYDVRDLLPRVSAPTLVIHTRGDSLVQLAAGVEIASRISGARFVPVEGTGHTLFRGEGAGAVRRVILDFLAQGSASQAGASAGAMPEEVALSHQQLRVLHLIAAGNSSAEMATTLVLSERTVQRHIANLYAKIHVHNRAEATAFALHLSHS